MNTVVGQGAHVIDVDVVRSRRLLVGLGHTMLADLLGASPMTIDWLEHGGEQAHLTLGFVTELARALGTTVADLMVDRPQPPAGTAPDDIEETDPAVVGQQLALIGRIHIDELTQVLGWTSGRVRWALHILEERLPGTGQALVWIADTEVQVAAAPGPEVVAQAVAARSMRARGLQENDARVLNRLLDETTNKSVAHLDKMALNRLRAAGLVSTDIIAHEDGRRAGIKRESARTTSQAKFALYLSDEPSAAAAH